MVEQPLGTVTLVFTDIEGSTRLLAELGQDRYRDVLAAHGSSLREAFARHDGYEVDNQGDSFFYAFASAAAAVAAVSEAMERSEKAGFECGSACTPANRSRIRRSTWAWTSTGRRGSWPLPTAARSSSRRRRATCWARTGSATSATTG
jgi:hypothetical protein